MTTRHRSRRLQRSARRAVQALAVLLLAAALAACSTARRREAPEGPLSLLHYRDPATARYFDAAYRSGNLYLDFRPALVVDAIVRDRAYRGLYVDTLRQQFLLPAGEVAKLQAEQEQEFETQVSLLVFLYEGTHTPTQITRPDAAWRLLLRDDDGQLQAPLAITRIKPDSQTYLYIDKYFQGLDRWSQVYRVDFPKLSKERLGQPVGAHPFELIVTGIKGTVTLRWEDARAFYALKDGAR